MLACACSVYFAETCLCQTNYILVDAGSIKHIPLSMEKKYEVNLVRVLLPEKDRQYRNLVTPKNLLELGLLQGSKLTPFLVPLLCIFVVVVFF